MANYFGIDFGTTNSAVVAIATIDGKRWETPRKLVRMRDIRCPPLWRSIKKPGRSRLDYLPKKALLIRMSIMSFLPSKRLSMKIGIGRSPGRFGRR